MGDLKWENYEIVHWWLELLKYPKLWILKNELDFSVKVLSAHQSAGLIIIFLFSCKDKFIRVQNWVSTASYLPWKAQVGAQQRIQTWPRFSFQLYL